MSSNAVSKPPIAARWLRVVLVPCSSAVMKATQWLQTNFLSVKLCFGRGCQSYSWWKYFQWKPPPESRDDSPRMLLPFLLVQVWLKSRNRMNQMPCTVIPTTHCLVALRKGPPHEQNCQERIGARARYRTRLVPGKDDMVETTFALPEIWHQIPKMTPCLKGNTLFKPFLVSRLDFGGVSLECRRKNDPAKIWFKCWSVAWWLTLLDAFWSDSIPF